MKIEDIPIETRNEIELHYKQQQIIARVFVDTMELPTDQRNNLLRYICQQAKINPAELFPEQQDKPTPR